MNRMEWWKENQKGMESSKMKCDIGNAVGAVLLIADFGSVNASVPIEETENIRPSVGLLCTVEEHRMFVSFFAKFTTVAREFFLPPEKHKFRLVSDRSMLSALGLGDSSSWLAVVYLLDAPVVRRLLKTRVTLIMHYNWIVHMLRSLKLMATCWSPLCQRISHQYYCLWIGHLIH